MEKEIFTPNVYGSVKMNIRKYMDAKDIKRGYLARKVGCRYETIDRWYKGELDRIDADVLARVCYVLDVTPGDILEYTILEPEK